MDTNDIVVTYFDPNPSVNRWGLDKDVGVKIVHLPTGMSTECSLHASRAENRISANFNLHQMLKERESADMPSGSGGADTNYPHIIMHATGSGGDVAKPSTFAAIPSINFHNIDMDQVKSDLDNNVIICRATLHKVIDIAYQAQKLLGHAKPVASSRATEAEEGPDVSKNKFTYNREQ